MRLVLFLVGFLGCAATAAQAQINLNTTTAVVVAKAAPDECYIALGQNVPFNEPPCVPGERPKINQSYVWSAVDTGDDIWFGTLANGLCTATNSGSGGDNATTPYETPSWACEFGSSPYSPPQSAEQGDSRPPHILVFNKASRIVTDVTPTVAGRRDGDDRFDSLLRKTAGFRAATVAGTHVIFAGPLRTGGLAFFAFDIATRKWVSKGDNKQYANIRKFETVNGIVYTGVRKTLAGGAILRYTGSFSSLPAPLAGESAPTCNACFTFDSVADLDSDAAYLTLHQGRIFVSTWPNGGIGGIYMGPEIPVGGYTKANVSQWIKVWDANQYEPDPVIATSYATGALKSFGGYLYWGTTNFPYESTLAWVNVYGPPTTEEELKKLAGYTYRNSAIFRCQGFETGTPQIDLLYGAPKLFAYTPPPDGGTGGTWALTTNKMPAGHTNPLYGSSGFNNALNIYTWEMALWQGKLWVGTFDSSFTTDQFALHTTIPAGSAAKPSAVVTPLIDPSIYGADLFFFQDTISPAIAEDTHGLGNYTNHGVRTLVPSGDKMFVGMANAATLYGDPALYPALGGYELIELTPKTATPAAK